MRKIKEAVGLEAKRFEPIGHYEYTYENNPCGLSIPFHSRGVVFSTVIAGCQKMALGSQSSDCEYSSKSPKEFVLKPFGSSHPTKTLQTGKHA